MSVSMYPIYTQTLASSAGIVSFNNIPSGFDDLKVIISARNSDTVSARGITFRFNNDVSLSYSSTELNMISGPATVSSSQFLGTNSFINGLIHGGTNYTANSFSNGILDIPNYNGANIKTTLSSGVMENASATDSYMRLVSGIWNNTSPITSIQFLPFGGTSSFVAGSTFTLYGISNKYDTRISNAPIITSITDIAGAASISFAEDDDSNTKNYSVVTNPTTVTNFTSKNTVTATNLNLNTSYTFNVRANNSLGAGISKASASLTTYNNYASIATVSANGNSNTITFSNIPQHYKHLQIRYISRLTASGDQIRLNFNNDTSAEYSQHELTGNGGSPYAGSNVNATNIPIIGFTTGTTHSSNVFGGGIIDIFDYNSTFKHKTTRTTTGYDNNGSGLSSLFSGLWQSFAPVISITLTTQSGNFAGGSHFALYGIGG